jgi:hypothetical protein
MLSNPCLKRLGAVNREERQGHEEAFVQRMAGLGDDSFTQKNNSGTLCQDAYRLESSLVRGLTLGISAA